MIVNHLITITMLVLCLTPFQSSAQTEQEGMATNLTAMFPAAIVAGGVADQLRQEITLLQEITEKQAKEITRQQDAVYDLRQKLRKLYPITAVGFAIAALIAGFFTLRNHNKQAAQERLLKAIEIIMDSGNGYQADIRKRNLEVFLDDVTKKHLENIDTEFAGDEWTNLSINLAQAMSEKVNKPEEVLEIWQSVFTKKAVITSVVYQKAGVDSQHHS